MSDSIRISRAPVLTLWAAVVAERLGSYFHCRFQRRRVRTGPLQGVLRHAGADPQHDVGVPRRSPPAAAGERLAGRAHVLDGDTIVVDGIHGRLEGVAAPEVAHFGKLGEGGGE